MAMFASREDAGLKLGRYLHERRVRVELVLGLPRGGVVVAAGVARSLQLPLDVLVVRKIGHPLQREFAVGALAENGVVVLDDRAVGSNPTIRTKLEEVVREEKERLRSYEARFHPKGAPDVIRKAVLHRGRWLGDRRDDRGGCAGGWSGKASKIVVAAPVASTNAVDRLARVADEVRVLWVDPAFDAVGRYYDVFSQTTDEEVLRALSEERERARTT